jgi:SAM-dependent methyltransferase
VGSARAEYPADPIKIETAPFIVEQLVRRFKPRNCLDLGCGTGIYVEEFRRQGVTAIGVEGNLAVKSILKTDPENVLFHDLRSPVPLATRYDLVFSIEVVEHIAEDYTEVLIRNLTQYCAKWLVITSGVDSHGSNPWHVNEQPKRYWIERIEATGFHFERGISKRLMRLYGRHLKGKGLAWFKKCLLVFSRLDNLTSPR